MPHLYEGSLIQVSPKQNKPIDNISKGNPIMTAGKDLQWSARNVISADHFVATSNKPAQAIEIFTDGDLQIIATPDQTFMLRNRTLITASRIYPGIQLLCVDGSTRHVQTAMSGMMIGAFYSVAASKSTLDDLDGHLLSVNGLICGDITLFVR